MAKRAPKLSYADRVRAAALNLPETYEDAPWGFPVFKVANNRLFAWMIEAEDFNGVYVTVKMGDEERPLALALDWVYPASHLGRYGWISATVVDAESLEFVLSWLEESWYLRAPVRLRKLFAATAD